MLISNITDILYLIDDAFVHGGKIVESLGTTGPASNNLVFRRTISCKPQYVNAAGVRSKIIVAAS